MSERTKPGLLIEAGKRPGLYVDERYYGVNRAQAEARARHIAVEHRRPVDVVTYDYIGRRQPIGTAQPTGSYTALI